MKDLTDRQKEVLAYVLSFSQEHSYPPTIREIAKGFSISVKGAYDHLKALERKGALRLGDNRSRSIQVLCRERHEDRYTEVPLLGAVAAGRPILSEENLEGAIRIPPELLRSRPGFALRVRGDSMRDAGILDGDLAIIEERPVPENGEIVVAMIDDAVTLKRFYRETGRIRLSSENTAYAPIYTQDARILGRLCGILRTY
ncbi:MAG TPA: transcriptional repressor LexA [Magnetospirillaceae bacterium]|nr:transcriptional repressor LexA [Magnetospirillaceae bacterium]